MTTTVAGLLSEREVEVLRLDSAGMLNRDIGLHLFIREKADEQYLRQTQFHYSRPGGRSCLPDLLALTIDSHRTLPRDSTGIEWHLLSNTPIATCNYYR